MNRILIGKVGVDSGQLMVTDPCYIKQFKINEYNPTRKYVSKADPLCTIEWPTDFYNYEEDIIPRPYNKNMNTLLKQGVFVKVEDDEIDSSYSCVGAYDQTTKNKNQGGSLGNGLGVSFATGFGDGHYPVYAYYEDVNGWGRRIKKIEIEFFTDEALEFAKNNEEDDE